MDVELGARARRLRAEGMTYKAVAAAMAISITTAWRLARDDQGMPRGERHWASKLTCEQARDIRLLAAAGENHGAIAARFGVGRSTVAKIAAGTRWKWLE